MIIVLICILNINIMHSFIAMITFLFNKLPSMSSVLGIRETKAFFA